MGWGNDGVQKPWLKKPSWSPSQNPKWGEKKWEGNKKWESKKGGNDKNNWVGKKPDPLPEDFEFDKEARYSGTVSGYWKWSGFGFLTVQQSGIVPKDRLYVHWSNIQTDDRYPFLVKGMQVEFGLLKRKEKDGVAQLRAKFVTLPGGGSVHVQNEQDVQKKTFVGGQELRYTGLMKFYHPREGYGYITMDEGYATSETVPKELRVEEAEIDAGGKRPQQWFENVQVEFGIQKKRNSRFVAYNVTMPGGAPLTRENLENRQTMGTQMFRGQVQYMNWRQGWGHITPDTAAVLPARVQSKLAQQLQAAKEKAKEGANPEKVIYFRKEDTAKGAWLKKGLDVSFQIYIDDKGVGAKEIQ